MSILGPYKRCCYLLLSLLMLVFMIGTQNDALSFEMTIISGEITHADGQVAPVHGVVELPRYLSFTSFTGLPISMNIDGFDPFHLTLQSSPYPRLVDGYTNLLSVGIGPFDGCDPEEMCYDNGRYIVEDYTLSTLLFTSSYFESGAYAVVDYPILLEMYMTVQYGTIDPWNLSAPDYIHFEAVLTSVPEIPALFVIGLGLTIFGLLWHRLRM